MLYHSVSQTMASDPVIGYNINLVIINIEILIKTE